MQKQKRINIVSKEGTAMRVIYSLGKDLVAQGTHYFTTKGKMKSLLNREKKIKNNMETLKHINLTKGNSEWDGGRVKVSKMPWNGRIAALVNGFIPDKLDKDGKPTSSRLTDKTATTGGYRQDQWFILKF